MNEWLLQRFCRWPELAAWQVPGRQDWLADRLVGFKTSIDGVERGTEAFYGEMTSPSTAKLFSDPSLGKSYRAFMVGLADRKGGLLPRMQRAARDVDKLIQTGGSVQGAKANVKREADALRAEATSLGEAADALGEFLGKLSCQ